jgi:hypothetical protein
MHETARCFGYPSDSTRTARERVREATCGHRLRRSGPVRPGPGLLHFRVTLRRSPPLHAASIPDHRGGGDDPAGLRARRAARGSAEGAVSAIRARRVREAKWSGREPCAGPGPGGGAARIRGWAKTTAERWNVAPRAHPGQRETGTSPTPCPVCTGPAWRLPGGGQVPSRPPGSEEAERGPRAGHGPGGSAARIRGGAKTTAATGVEGRETGDPSRAPRDPTCGAVRHGPRAG